MHGTKMVGNETMENVWLNMCLLLGMVFSAAKWKMKTEKLTNID